MTSPDADQPGRWLWPILLCGLLAGCVVPDAEGAGPDAAEKTTTQDGIVLVGPHGFCLLDESHVWQDQAEFAALLPCDGVLSLTVPGAMLTVTVAAAGSAEGLDLTGKALAAYFTGAEGRTAISSVGRPETVRVHEVRETSGAVVVRMTDSSARFPGLGWRAVTSVRGHLVTLTVRGNSEKQLAEAAGRRLINRFVDVMHRANGE